MNEPTIKSATRTLQIFELFAELRRPATITDIYRKLKVPQSSVSKLLQNFVKLGYVQFDKETRTYVPTLRTAILSSWLHDQWFTHHSMLHVLESLCRDLKTSVILGVQNDTRVLYMLTLLAPMAHGPTLPIGTLRPICRAAVGKALLMTKPDKEVGLLVRRINAEETDRTMLVNIDELLEDLNESRLRGYAISNGAVVPGVKAVAVPWPSLPGQPRMAVGLAGYTNWFTPERLQDCVEALQRTLQIDIKMPDSPAGG